MSSLEIVAVLFGIANIALIIRRSLWNFPVALAMVTIYGVIFWDAKLYSDAGLQAFFFAVNLCGWWMWGRDKAGAGEIVVDHLSVRGRVCWAVGSLIATALWGWLMARYTDASYPYWDGAVAMLSVAAQILMTRRYIDNWTWWIAVNLISVPLYLVKGLYLTAGLYGLFLVLAIVGLREWKRAARA